MTISRAHYVENVESEALTGKELRDQDEDHEARVKSSL